MTIQGHPPFFLKPQPRFVTMRGGEYLYRPSMSGLRWLAAGGGRSTRDQERDGQRPRAMATYHRVGDVDDTSAGRSTSPRQPRLITEASSRTNDPRKRDRRDPLP